MISMRWPKREGLLLLGGIVFAFLAWIPVVINVLPKLFGVEPESWQWGFKHLPEFFGSRGAGHAVMSWLVALIPYFLVQLGRGVNWSARMYRSKRPPREGIASMPTQEGS